MKTSSLVRRAAPALAVLALASLARAQAADTPAENVPPVTRTISLSGPRFGVTFLSPGVVDQLRTDYDIRVRPLVTQFGWQFEKRLYGGAGGLSAVTEWVVLAGGLEQGQFLPSANWLVGIRTRTGTEFGLGPNLNPAGTGLVLAAGRTFRAGALNFPVNLALVPSKSGLRVSLLCGFNTRR